MFRISKDKAVVNCDSCDSVRPCPGCRAESEQWTNDQTVKWPLQAAPPSEPPLLLWTQCNIVFTSVWSLGLSVFFCVLLCCVQKHVQTQTEQWLVLHKSARCHLRWHKQLSLNRDNVKTEDKSPKLCCLHYHLTNIYLRITDKGHLRISCTRLRNVCDTILFMIWKFVNANSSASLFH